MRLQQVQQDSSTHSSIPHNIRQLPLQSFYSLAALSQSIPSNIDSNRPHRGELFPDFVSRPYSAGGLSVPVGPRVPGPTRHKKNMREMIGITTEAEFDELPIAVRRKYFSTLERLRLARNSGSIITHDLDRPVSRKRSLAERRQLRNPLTALNSNSSTGLPTPRQLRGSSRSKSITAAEAAWFLSLPDKIRRKQFTKEEQIRLAGGRDSIILDAADEAIYKSSRRNRNPAPVDQLPSTPLRLSMDSSRSVGVISERPTGMALAMAESFRWMDEETDLDLRLVLDDYHANLPDVVIPTPTSHIRPSFRRHMSISKMPFGRASLSSPTRSTSSSIGILPPAHSRQRSRAVSLISPKFSPDSPRHSIDPHATHYQDPEARLKLRVYLASPQKFDEAIEFGFPSADGVSDPSSTDKENQVPNIRITRDRAATLRHAGLSDSSHTFFNDDVGSLLDDDTSMADPESPRTPHETDRSFLHHKYPSHAGRLMSLPGGGNSAAEEFSHLGIRKPSLHRHTESYSLASAGSREMTLRMTLTRPDLRADEEVIYGWQGQSQGQGQGQREKERERTKAQLAPEPEVSVEEKVVMRGPFEGPDGWGLLEKDDGVVKRLWNRVRSQRKTSAVFGN